MTIQTTSLPNDLRIVTDAISHVETVACGIWVDVGTRHEPADLNGISHVLEHMAFKGTKRRTAQQIAEEIEAVGGYLNAYTSREATAYHARILKDDVPLAIDILADILQNSIFDATEFAREQDVIVQEIGQAYDTPEDIVFDYFQETCYPDQPMGRTILGTAENVKALTPAGVKDYMAGRYGAQQMVFAAAGNLNHDEIAGLVAEKFNALPRGCSPQFMPAVYQAGACHRKRKLEQTHIVLGYEGLSYSHPDRYAASILSTLLGGGMSSRLFQEIREKRGLAYSVYTFAASYQDSGILGMYAGTSPAQAKELVSVAGQEFDRIAGSLKMPEFRRAKAQVKAEVLMGLESTSARCEQLATHMLSYGRLIPYAEILKEIEGVCVEDVTRLADRIFSTPMALTTLGTGI